MKPRNLIIAAVVLVALLGAIYWAEKHPSSDAATAASTDIKLAAILPSQVKALTIHRRDGSELSLQRDGTNWRITSPEPYNADGDAMAGTLAALNPLNADSVIEDKPSDLSKFGLDKPLAAVAVQQTSGATATLNIGNDVPTTQLVYGTWGSLGKVYAFPATVKTAFDKTVNDLRDKRLITADSTKWNRLTLTNAKGTVEFSKNPQGDWSIEKPQPYRTDTAGVGELVRKITEARMDLNEEPSAAKSAYASGTPVATVKVNAGSDTQTLVIHKKGSDFYAVSSVVPGTFKLMGADLGSSLDKSVDDFRNKKLFDFGFADPDKIQLDGDAYVRSGVDWKHNGQTMDSGSIQVFVDAVRELSASRFVTTPFTQPVATLTVQWNGYKNTNTVQFAKVADGYLARRLGEPSVYQLDAKSVDDVLHAGKAIKPAPAKK